MDSQILNNLENCPTALKFAHVDFLKPWVKPEAFEKGDLIHDMLRLWRTLQVHRGAWTIDKRLDLCLRLGNKKMLTMNADQEDLERVVEYFKYYVSTKYVRDVELRTMSIEKPFIKKIYECEDFHLFYTGQPDWIFEDDPNFFGQGRGTLFPLDTKSGSKNVIPHKLSNQFIGYCYVLECEHLIVDKVNFYVKLDPDKSFVRTLVPIDKWLKERWYAKVIKRAHQYFNFLQNGIDEYSDTNYTSCDKYSGCIFRDICEAVPSEQHTIESIRAYIKARDFKVDKAWDISKLLEQV